MEHFDDILLMREIQNGNRAAFDVLVHRHAKYLFAIAYRFMGTRADAEDVLQAAFLKLWERPYKFDCDNGASFKTWFARVVINQCHDDRRSRRPIQNIDDFEIPDDGIGAADVIESKQKQMIIRNAIKRLSPKYQNAINLGAIQDMQYEDVAKIMGEGIGNVKTLISRAKEKLRFIIKEQGYAFG